MFSDLITFIKTPRFAIDNSTNNDKFKRLAFSVGIYFLIVMILGWGLLGYNKILMHLFHKDFISGRDESIKSLFGNSTFLIVLFMCFLGPLVEELIFRGWLTFQKEYIVITSFLLTWMTLTLLAGQNFYTQPINPHFIIRLIIAMLVSFLVFYYIRRKKIEDIGRKYFSFLFYFSASIFSLIHISNYRPLSIQFLILCIPFVLPQFVLGLVLGYNRIKSGFIWSLAFHIFINLFSLIAFFN